MELFGGWDVKFVIGFSCGCAPDGNGEFDRAERGQAVIVEDAADGGAERFETDAAVFAVVLDLAELRGLCDAVVEHEAVCAAMGYAEDEDGSFAAVAPHSLRPFLHVEEKVPGEGDGVVGGVGYDVAA